MTAPARIWALLACAGSGTRAARSAPKQYQPLCGQPLVQHTLCALQAVPQLHHTLVVVSPADDFAFPPSCTVARCGGETRAQSVHNGLQALQALGAQAHDWVLVHDAARCLITPALVQRLIGACAPDAVGGLLALPLTDTLLTADGGGPDPAPVARASGNLARSGKWLAQTPQMFRLHTLMQALHAAGARATDEASAVQALGLQPLLVPGSADNFKVTWPADFALAEAVLAQRKTTPPQPCGRLRIGQGWDSHALVPGRALILGGVHIPHPAGLLGHSDADALCHAITDALLGAAGLGDIGQHFPDTDARFRGASSIALLAQAMQRVRVAGFELIHLDSTILAQAPKLAPHLPAMRARMAGALGVAEGQVNIKAKTAENLGPVGQRQAIEAQAVALVAG